MGVIIKIGHKSIDVTHFNAVAFGSRVNLGFRAMSVGHIWLKTTSYHLEIALLKSVGLRLPNYFTPNP